MHALDPLTWVYQHLFWTHVAIRGQCYKTFFIRNLRIFPISLVFVPGKLFQPSLTCLKGRPDPTQVKQLSGEGWLLALPTKIRLRWKSFPRTNTSLLRKCINYRQKFWTLVAKTGSWLILIRIYRSGRGRTCFDRGSFSMNMTTLVGSKT
jgi:hypothetical protein